MADETTVFNQIRAIYYETHGEEAAKGRPISQVGQHEAIWDALLLLAARIDGDAERNPRADRPIEDREYVDGEGE